MSAIKPIDEANSAKPPVPDKPKPFEHGLVYSKDAALEIMDSDTFTRRKGVLEAARFEIHSVAVGDTTLVVILSGKNKGVGHAAEIKTPTQAQLDAATKLADAQAKEKTDRDAEAAKAKSEAKPAEKPAA